MRPIVPKKSGGLTALPDSEPLEIGPATEPNHAASLGLVTEVREELSGLIGQKIPINFAEYLITNVTAGYDIEDADHFSVDVTWVFLNPEEGYPKQTFSNPIPIASDDAAGLMSKADVVQLRSNTIAIESIRNQGVYIGRSFDTKADLDAFVLTENIRENDYTVVLFDETQEGRQSRYVVVNKGTAEDPVLGFVFEKIETSDPVGNFHTGASGLIVGSPDNGQNSGKIYAENDGTGAVIGWNALKSDVSNNAAAILDKQAAITGAATTITAANLTANRALLSSATGKVAVSSVTSTQLGYLSGVTSNIQTQLNGKQTTISGAATTIAASNLTTNRALVSDSSGKVAVSSVTSTQLGYLSGVTSNIQTQLNAKGAGDPGYSTVPIDTGMTYFGKPVYRCMFNYGNAIGGGTWYTANHNISNIETILKVDALCKMPYGNDFFIVPPYHVSSTNAFCVKATTTSCAVLVAGSYSDYRDIVFTLEFTRKS